MTADELKAGIVLSSIQLRRLGQNNKPTGCGSGCLIHYTGKLLVLTVAHVTGDFNNWAIQVEWIPSLRRTQLYQIGQMNFLAKLSLDTKATPEIDFEKAERLDFSYAVLKKPVTPLYQEIEPDGTVKNSIETLTLETALDCVPNFELEYGFYGHANGKYKGEALIHAARLEMRMKFLGEQGNFYLFQMQPNNLLLEDYQGCSGAPILDSDGQLVSLVVSVWAEGNQVRGVKLSNYKAAIDVECGNI